MHYRDTTLVAPADPELALPASLAPWERLVSTWRRLWPIGWLFNSGSPMGRRLVERIRSTLVGEGPSALAWSRYTVVVLDISPQDDPLDYAENVLRKCGYDSPEAAARERADLPLGSYHCHEQHLTPKQRKYLAPQAEDEILRAALILGLCGPSFYARDRAHIWTSGRLARAVGLYKTVGFYEN